MGYDVNNNSQPRNGTALDLLYPISHISRYDLPGGISALGMLHQWWALCLVGIHRKPRNESN